MAGGRKRFISYMACPWHYIITLQTGHSVDAHKAFEEQIIKEVTTDLARSVARLSQFIITNQNVATSGFETCFAPSTFGGGVPNQTTPRMQHITKRQPPFD